MLYQDEFRRMKKIYDKMPSAKREMVGPILGLPVACVVIFGAVLVPFGVIGVPGLLVALLLASGISLYMLRVIDIREEFAEWRAGAAVSEGDELPAGEAAIRMLSVANDPGQGAVQTAATAGKQARQG